MSFIPVSIKQWFQRRRARRISLDDARSRVQRGAAYLDGMDPEWHRRVDPVTLKLSSGSSCVLGQLHGDFRMGLSRSQLIDLSSAPRTSLSPVAYGFQCVQGVSDAMQERDYAYLDIAWREAVRQRQDDDPLFTSGEGRGDRTAVHSERASEPAAAQPV